jgi:hypothetical protein
MIEVSTCVICDQPIKRLKKALVAPFVAKRIWGMPPFRVDLVGCDSCGFRFYNPRLDDSELAREYHSFRLYDYFQMRNSFEPWFTEEFNRELGSPSSYQYRRKLLAPIFNEHLNGRSIRRVLDYGGDQGGLISGLFENAELFVYDLSGVQTLPGVKAVEKPAECRPDLIVNSNVLEHVGFPREMTLSMIQAAPVGGLVFIEVPCEEAFGFSRILRRIAQVIIMTVRTPKLSSSLLRPEAFYMMHEHINYFKPHCLNQLVQSCGARVVGSGTYPYSSKVGAAEMAWCLAEKV